MNDKSDTSYGNLWNITKAVLRESLQYEVPTLKKKSEISRIDNLTSYHKELEKQEQNKLKAS